MFRILTIYDSLGGKLRHQQQKEGEEDLKQSFIGIMYFQVNQNLLLIMGEGRIQMQMIDWLISNDLQKEQEKRSKWSYCQKW